MTTPGDDPAPFGVQGQVPDPLAQVLRERGNGAAAADAASDGAAADDAAGNGQPVRAVPPGPPPQAADPAPEDLRPADAAEHDAGDVVVEAVQPTPDPPSPPRPVVPAPEWWPRRALYLLLVVLTWGHYRLPASTAELTQREKVGLFRNMRRLNIVAGTSRFIAIWSQKGGVGKTTVAVKLALLLSQVYYWHSIALVDANKDSGSLKTRIPQTSHRPTAVGLLEKFKDEDITHIAMLEPFLRMLQYGARALVLARSPKEAKNKLPMRAWEKLTTTFRRLFELTIFDLGTGLEDTASKEVLSKLIVGQDLLLVVSGRKPDEVEQTLGNYEMMFTEPDYAKYRELALRSILVITGVKPTTDVEAIIALFRERFGADFDQVQVFVIHNSKFLDDGFEPDTALRAEGPDGEVRVVAGSQWANTAVIDINVIEHEEPDVFLDVCRIAAAVAEHLAAGPDGSPTPNPLSIF